MSILKADFYLALSPKKTGSFSGSELIGRLSAKPPALARGEVAMRLSISVPKSLFEIPALRASVTIPPEAVAPALIDATVIDNVQEVLRQQTGLDVVVEVING